ncbi:sugar phosphate isomerase/epimerase [Alteribacillus sp. YIM 98480]|uniref:sugar phosphate isomerase/epimerase family protein n=1 Tax=Alteribacillus sp. YIM 98480 TaxID=2606599 RepID=UPI00131A8724|nr:sugar phosphate isomerase/epimerase family protein [Alteribacillus sp. YIM 98480]
MDGTIKKGICIWSLPIEGPYACKLASESGFEGIQLELGTYERGFPLSKKYIQDAYLEMGKTYNIDFPSIAVRELDYYGMTRPDRSQEKQIAKQGIEKAIETARDMDIPIVMLGSFADGEIKNEIDLQNVTACLREACDMAENYNITIGTENVLSVDETKRLFQNVNRANLKLYFDTQNYYLFKGYDTTSMIQELHPYFCEVHAKDGKDNISSCLLGEGDSSFHSSMEELIKSGYTGWINIENYYDLQPLRLEHDDELTLIKKDLDTLKSTILSISTKGSGE